MSFKPTLLEELQAKYAHLNDGGAEAQRIYELLTKNAK